MTYETLDTIADAYNPTWLTCVIAALLLNSYREKTARKKANYILSELALILTYAFWVYGWMLLDNALHLWPTFNADYSTHTAVAVCLSLYLAFHVNRSIKVGLCIVFTSYCTLMLYQKYHSVFDILSTSLFTVVGVTTIHWFKKKLFNKRMKKLSSTTT